MCEDNDESSAFIEDEILAAAEFASRSARAKLLSKRKNIEVCCLQKSGDGKAIVAIPVSAFNSGVVTQSCKAARRFCDGVDDGCPTFSPSSNGRSCDQAAPLIHSLYHYSEGSRSNGDSDDCFSPEKLAVYGGITGARFANSIQRFTKDAGQPVRRMVDSLLDSLTFGAHSVHKGPPPTMCATSFEAGNMNGGNWSNVPRIGSDVPFLNGMANELPHLQAPFFGSPPLISPPPGAVLLDPQGMPIHPFPPHMLPFQDMSSFPTMPMYYPPPPPHPSFGMIPCPMVLTPQMIPSSSQPQALYSALEQPMMPVHIGDVPHAGSGSAGPACYQQQAVSVGQDPTKTDVPNDSIEVPTGTNLSLPPTNTPLFSGPSAAIPQSQPDETSLPYDGIVPVTPSSSDSTSTELHTVQFFAQAIIGQDIPTRSADEINMDLINEFLEV